MNAEQQNFRHTAVISAIVKDDNRLTSEEEKASSRTRAYYVDIMTLYIQKHAGRVINTANKSFLAAFSSVDKALSSALEIQGEIRAMNARAPKNRKLNFGIGINYGDVIEGQGLIYGEGVSIATGLAGLASVGGICISGTAYDQIKNEAPFTFGYRGDHTLDHVKAPVRMYRVAVDQRAIGKLSGDKNEKPKHKKKVAQRIHAVLILAVIVGVFWFFYLRDVTPPLQEIASGEHMASVLSDKPSIAVLPFVDLYKDPDQENLSDAVTSNIITHLAKFKGMTIIPLHRMVAYKGRPVRFKDLRRELGVQYVVEGSVRQAGDKVRIYAHLMDIKGRSLWAEKYDRNLADLAVAQDEIVQKIATLMAVKREVAE